MIGKNMKVGATVFGLALGGGLLAGSVLGAPGTTSAASKSPSPSSPLRRLHQHRRLGHTRRLTQPPSRPPPHPETPLEGDVATQVTAAAQAAVPDGTIDRVETDNDGVYEAHVTKADGTHVIVQIGADYCRHRARSTSPRVGPVARGGPVVPVPARRRSQATPRPA